MRIPGKRFLKKVSGLKPTTRQFQSHDYWKEIRSDLYEAYNHVCAYNAHWIARGSSTPTIDHFIPKSVKPELAYEWNNYRLASDLANKLKSTWQDVLDPFCIEENWFFLDFPSLLIHPNSELLPAHELRNEITPSKQTIVGTKEYLSSVKAKKVKGREERGEKKEEQAERRCGKRQERA